MRFRIIALMTAVALCVVSGCNQTGNENRTANANANANANVPIIASSTPVPNANNNTNSRRAPTREEYERDKERYNREAKNSGSKVGTGLNDGWLWAKARFDLAAADDLRDSTINVDVNNAVVTLTGTVATQDQVRKADQVAKAIEGVKGVQNKLKVAANTGNANANANAKPKTK